MNNPKKLNILFLTLVSIDSLNERGIYQDLLRKFVKEGHEVTIVTPVERRRKLKTNISHFDSYSILQVKTLNITKTNIIEKGIGTISIEAMYLSAIKKYLPKSKFDLLLYSTPPITFVKVISYIKKRDQALAYLLLKDIFPQNAVDIGLMKEKSLIHSFFRRKEKALYQMSDFIGCMSPANVDFVLNNNPFIDKRQVEVCPNSIEIDNTLFDKKEITTIRKNHNIPQNSIVFIYGGNLGKPQGVDFLLKVLESNKDKKDRYFLIVGSGTEYYKIKEWFYVNNPTNAKLIPGLPKEEYDKLLRSCDVGLIFLDPRFSIPNYPSRLLSYLENKMPVLMATDKNTDIGKIAEENGYGVWTENGNLEGFNRLLGKFCDKALYIKEMGEKGYAFLKENYTVDKSYEIIMKHFN